MHNHNSIFEYDVLWYYKNKSNFDLKDVFLLNFTLSDVLIKQQQKLALLMGLWTTHILMLLTRVRFKGSNMEYVLILPRSYKEFPFINMHVDNNEKGLQTVNTIIVSFWKHTWNPIMHKEIRQFVTFDVVSQWF